MVGKCEVALFIYHGMILDFAFTDKFCFTHNAYICVVLFSRPDTLDPALLRPGRLDRKVEFGLPDLESRTQIFKIHTRTMNCERDIRFELLSRLCPNSTGKFPLSKILLCCVF